MCDANSRALGTSAIRPRWGLLYATALPQVAGLVVVEAVHPTVAVRVTLRLLLALGIFATMSMWIRANRPAIDLQDWCDCAGQRMTIRVIESRRPLALPPVEPAPLVSVSAGEEYELTAR